MIRVFFNSGEAGERFAFAESGVDEESGALCLQQRDVAGTPGRQDGNAKADQCPPKYAATNSGMMAERTKSVNEGILSGISIVLRRVEVRGL